jgi:hypothetical protein
LVEKKSINIIGDLYVIWAEKLSGAVRFSLNCNSGELFAKNMVFWQKKSNKFQNKEFQPI